MLKSIQKIPNGYKMRLDKILDILYGSLVNTPYISHFSTLSSEISEVKKGTLFFAINENDIESAVKKGAYGVVFQGECEIIDNEIAWIKVNSLEVSIFRLIRYLILEGEYIFLMMNSIEIESICKIETDFSCKILKEQKISDTLNYFFSNYINNIESKIIILTNLKEFEKIEVMKLCSLLYTKDMIARNYDFSNNEFIKVTQKKIALSITYHSIFETKIIFNDRIYTLNYPYIFLPFLQSAISLISDFNATFNDAKLSFSIKENIKYFEHIFIDKNFNAAQKGLHKASHKLSQKAIIFLPNTRIFSFITLNKSDFKNLQNQGIKLFKSDENTNFLEILLRYLKLNISYLNVILCYKNKIPIKKTFIKCSILPYAHIASLTQILSQVPFDIAIVCDTQKNELDSKALLESKALQDSKSIRHNTLF